MRWSARQPVVFPLDPGIEENYAKARASAFRKQLAPAINVTITALALFPVVAWFFPSIVNPLPFHSLALALNAELVLWLLSRTLTRLWALQILAVISFVVPLALLVTYFVFDISYYLIVIFVMGLVLPWNGAEAILISILPVLAFYGVHGRALELAGLADDTIVFVLSVVTVSRLQFREERERRRRFALESEAAESRQAITESLEFAARIHADLITADLDLPFLSSRVLYEPMQLLGGDFVQVSKLLDSRAAMLMADVTGHGVPAALMVNRIHERVLELMTTGVAPADAARGLNAFVTRAFEGTGMLMSAIWIEYDAALGALTWINHGHPPALLISPADFTVRRLLGHAFFMGVDLGRDVFAETITVEPGSILVTYTDGLIEMPCADGPLGIDKLSDTLVVALRALKYAPTAEDVIRSLRGLVRERREGEAQDDLLAVAWRLGEPPDPTRGLSSAAAG
jgi:serine phosphatase RsbU (regulator of sigma subunit)